MNRGVALLFAVATAGGTAVWGAGTGHAGPPPPCSYALSPPAVVQVDGAAVVTATVAPADCGYPANPRMAVACVQRQGDETTMRCIQGKGEEPARVFAPYQPGATYVSSGRGCGGWTGITEIAPDCLPLGPLTATL